MNNLDLSHLEALKVKDKPLKGQPRNQHEEIVVTFMNRLNEDRTREKNFFRYREWLKVHKCVHSVDNINKFYKSKDCYKPLTYTFTAKLLKKFCKQDKYLLLKECEKAKSFGACFWCKIKK